MRPTKGNKQFHGGRGARHKQRVKRAHLSVTILASLAIDCASLSEGHEIHFPHEGAEWASWQAFKAWNYTNNQPPIEEPKACAGWGVSSVGGDGGFLFLFWMNMKTPKQNIIIIDDQSIAKNTHLLLRSSVSYSYYR